MGTGEEGKVVRKQEGKKGRKGRVEHYDLPELCLIFFSCLGRRVKLILFLSRENSGK